MRPSGGRVSRKPTVRRKSHSSRRRTQDTRSSSRRWRTGSRWPCRGPSPSWGSWRILSLPLPGSSVPFNHHLHPPSGNVADLGGDLGLAAPGSLRNPERMVSVRNHVEGGELANLSDGGLKKFDLAQGISCARDEEHRYRDAGQMLLAKLVGPFGRMERIPQENEPGTGVALGRQVRCHAPTHRLPAQKQGGGLELLFQPVRDRAPTGLELRLPIGGSLSVFTVEEVESSGGSSLSSQAAAELLEKARVHVASRTMRER